MADIIRILRVIEYVGPRAAVEKQVANSKHGDHRWGNVTMKIATVGHFHEILSGDDERLTKDDYEAIYGWGGQG